jgi:hypothetical protein
MNTQTELLKTSLENIASREFPESFSLLHREKISSPVERSYWNRRKVVAWVLILLALTCAAFAFYKIFIDPGLLGARDAGLGNNPNQTAQITVLPATPTSVISAITAVKLDQQQTLDGVTLNLEWAALNHTGLIVGFHVSGLTDGESVGMPEAAFTNVSPQDPRGQSLQLYSGEGISGEFTSLQVINDEKANAGVDVTLSIPITDNQGNVIQTFSMPLSQLPMGSTQPTSGEFTHLGKIADVEVRMDWVNYTRNWTRVKLCYDLPQGAAAISQKDLQFAIADPSAEKQESSADFILPAADEDGKKCLVAQFPLNYGESDTTMVLSIDHIGDVKGPWSFMMQPSERGPFTEASTVTPTARPTLDSESAQSLTANLIWAYADEKRLAFEVKFNGWKDTYYLGQFDLKDNQGKEITSGYGSTSLGTDPSDQLMHVNFDSKMISSDGKVNLQVDLPIYDSAQSNQIFVSFHFSLDELKVYQEKEILVNQDFESNGITMQVNRVRYTPSYTSVVLCYNKPAKVGANSDWWPSHALTLSIGKLKSQNESGKLLSDSDLGGAFVKGTPPADLPVIDNGRCVEIGFPIGTLAGETSQTATLIIPQLEISQPEVIPQSELDASSSKLKELGIQLQQQTFSGNGGGGGGLVITQKPLGMSDADAMNLVFQALGYQYPGPWVFSFELPPDDQ